MNFWVKISTQSKYLLFSMNNVGYIVKGGSHMIILTQGILLQKNVNNYLPK